MVNVTLNAKYQGQRSFLSTNVLPCEHKHKQTHTHA